MSGSQWGQALTTTVGGAEVLNTTLTVPHWFGSTLDPHNGVTYGHNIVGADPNNCSGADCDVTVTVDIIPLNVIVDGEPLNGSDVVAATLASPIFALNDYGSIPFATDLVHSPTIPSSSKDRVESSHRTMPAINSSFRTLSSGRSSTKRARARTI
jgi:hypothetical protein